MHDYPRAKKLIGRAGWCFAGTVAVHLFLLILSQPGVMKEIGEHPASAFYFLNIGLYFAFIYCMVYAAGATGRNKILWAFLASVISLIALLILQDRISKDMHRSSLKEQEIPPEDTERDSTDEGEAAIPDCSGST